MLQMIQSFDEAVLLWFQSSVRAEWLNPAVKFFTVLGNAGLIWILLSVVLVLFKKTRRLGIASGMALFFSLLVTNLGLKPIFSRTRPYETVEGLIPLLRSSDLNSFPSGHTSAAFAAGIAWASVSPSRTLRVIAVAQAVLMALSRLYVGVHYPTDVLAGMAAGCLCGFLAAQTMKYFDRRKQAQI